MNFVQYIGQIKAHRKRMLHWGYYSFDGAFRGYRERRAAIMTSLRFHDIEKWLFLPLLFIFREGKGNRRLARMVYDAMNAFGYVISSIVLLGYTQDVKGEARRVERMFDCLDRSLDPVARIELGDGENPPPLSNFLSATDLEEAKSYSKYWNSVNVL